MRHSLTRLHPLVRVACCALTIAASVAGCLERPASFARDAAPDARRSVPAFGVQSVAVIDAEGSPWSPDAMPRRPVLLVTFTHAMSDETPSIFVFEHPDTSATDESSAAAFDESLRGDLDSAPLRASTQSALVDCTVSIDGTVVRIEPSRALRPGARLALGIAGWASDALGRRLGEALVVSLRVDPSRHAGAQVLQAWPPDAASGVGLSLPMAALWLDGDVDGVSASTVWLEDERGHVLGAAVTLAPCEDVGWIGERCILLVPGAQLAPRTRHFLRVEGLRDATGALLDDFVSSFSTGSLLDDDPPAFLPSACALDADVHEIGCVFADDGHVELTLRASEPVRIRARALGRDYRSVAPRGEATLRMGPFAASRTIELELTLTDSAGLETRVRLTTTTLEPLAPISISEVRSDPFGPEPHQEYVELLNIGSAAINLEGFALADDASREGDVIVGPVMLAAGGRALLVADAFDAGDTSGGRDAPVPAGARLVRIGASLGSGGLTNGGEPLFLRDPMGHRVSAAPPTPTGAGRCLERVSDGPRGGAATDFRVSECTPGR